jgi:hypothetical protein
MPDHWEAGMTMETPNPVPVQSGDKMKIYSPGTQPSRYLRFARTEETAALHGWVNG